VAGDTLLIERGEVTIALNCGVSDVPLPDGRVLVASGPVGATLPPDTAVWLRR
jgi:alpha-glucosidase